MKFILPVFLLFCCSSYSSAASFSYTGRLAQDDAVEIFQFNVTSSSSVTIRTFSYAGGTNQIGSLIPEGGLDPYIALFDGRGTLLTDNDDGTGVPVSPVTNLSLDAALTQTLSPGSYTLALTQFDNFALGPDLASGFLESGAGNYTSLFGCSNGSFCDIDGNNRTSLWAIDLLNVASATGPPNAIPEPASVALVAFGIFAAVYRSRRTR